MRGELINYQLNRQLKLFKSFNTLINLFIRIYCITRSQIQLKKTIPESIYLAHSSSAFVWSTLINPAGTLFARRTNPERTDLRKIQPDTASENSGTLRDSDSNKTGRGGMVPTDDGVGWWRRRETWTLQIWGILSGDNGEASAAEMAVKNAVGVTKLARSGNWKQRSV